jgi:rfaE bifunctional protein nucleotidyltransferase chain/domain
MSAPFTNGDAENRVNGVALAPSVADRFAEAQNYHRADRFSDAEGGYRSILRDDATHLPSWFHLGLACLAQNKIVEACHCFEQILAVNPDDVDTLFQIGLALARQGRVHEAIARFRRAIELRSDFAKAHNNLGVALNQLGRHEEGLACHREAVRLQPDYAEAHYNIGVFHADRKQIGEAITCYERALRARPDYPDALFALGMLLLEERRVSEALSYLEQAARLVPNHPDAHNNLGNAYADAGRFEEAIASCNEALRLRPHDHKAHSNRANVLSALGRMEDAISAYDFALRLQPDYINARWNRSLAYLGLGDFQRGWPEYESRWQKPETKTRYLPEPRWDGSPLEDKTILLWCEQGVGDTFQFVRYAFQLKKRGANVWLECPGHLVALLSTCPGLDRVLPEGSPLPPGFDFHAPLMSLPFLCGTTLATVPTDVPYLSADAAEVERWRKEFSATPHFKIGITWQGNPQHRYDRHRSFSVQWFRELATLDGVQLYSLQKGHGADQLQTARFPIIDLRGPLDELGGTFQNTAAAVQALDLIVTCDSAVAHLAGALGVPVWVPMATVWDWRWLRDREDSPWYPTLRLFRQDKLGDWRPVFERVRDEVRMLRDARAKSSQSTMSQAAPSEKIVSWPTLMTLRASARSAGKTVVWTNGCFDLLHVGHIRNLQAARSLGDMLIVGVNSDDSVSRLKGQGRPIVPAMERMELLAGLACVDHVIEFDEDTPLEAIYRLQPDIHCKGADYAPPDGKPIPEAEVVEAYGGRIEFLPLVPGLSSTDFVKRVQQAGCAEEPESHAATDGQE